MAELTGHEASILAALAQVPAGVRQRLNIDAGEYIGYLGDSAKKIGRTIIEKHRVETTIVGSSRVQQTIIGHPVRHDSLGTATVTVTTGARPGLQARVIPGLPTVISPGDQARMAPGRVPVRGDIGRRRP